MRHSQGEIFKDALIKLPMETHPQLCILDFHHAECSYVFADGAREVSSGWEGKSKIEQSLSW